MVLKLRRRRATLTYHRNVGLTTESEHLGCLGETDARQTCDIITARQDTGITELVKCVRVRVKTQCFVQVALLHQTAVAIQVHLEHDLLICSIITTVIITNQHRVARH